MFIKIFFTTCIIVTFFTAKNNGIFWDFFIIHFLYIKDNKKSLNHFKMGFLGIFYYPFFYHNKLFLIIKLLIIIIHFKLCFYYKNWDFLWDFCYPPLPSFKKSKIT